MTRTRIILVLGLIAAGVSGAYWAVSAQEGRPLFPPPPVLNLEEKPKYPNQTTPLKDKSKADPTTIIPAAVYDKPRVFRGEVTEIMPAQGSAPLPLPAIPITPDAKTLTTPPPLPQLDLKTLPMPVSDPSRALIIDPPPKEAGKPALPALEFPATPPSLTLPSATTTSQPEIMPLGQKPKAFVRIRSNVNEKPLTPMIGNSAPAARSGPLSLFPSLPDTLPAGGHAARAHAPSISVEKVGNTELRGGQSYAYELHVRNLGPLAAQQVRVEDELPANAKVISADPTPITQGSRLTWLLSEIPVDRSVTLRYLMQTPTETKVNNRVNVSVSAASQGITTTSALNPRQESSAITAQLVPPSTIMAGKPAVFEIRVGNRSSQSMTGIVLRCDLPQGLCMIVNDESGAHEVRDVETPPITESIGPGETKTLRMPTTAVKPGRYTVTVGIKANGGAETSASLEIEVVPATALQLRLAPSMRMSIGQPGDVRIEVTNHSDKPMKNVTVIDRLPDGMEFVAASDRGMYQSNHHQVYWVIDLSPGQTQTRFVKLQGTKAGQYQNMAFVQAEGMPGAPARGSIILDGVADLNVRITTQHSVVEIGNEATYEIAIMNPGGAPVNEMRAQVQLPPALTAKAVQSNVRYSIERDKVVFDMIPALRPQEQIILRVSAVAQPTTERDQRVRVMVTSQQSSTPIERQISTMVVPR